MARNEAPVIGFVIDHLWANGVNRVVVEDGSSTDETAETIEAHGAILLRETTRECDQSARMSRFAAEYAEPGDWVIPFDADEWWCGIDGTLADTLRSTDAVRAAANMYLHRDPRYRRPYPKPLMKVAFRYEPGAIIAEGAHNTTVTGPEAQNLQVREWQYRSWEHFLEKVEKARGTFADSPNMPASAGTHMRRLVAMSRAELLAEWAEHLSWEWVYDPIPSSHVP